MAEPTNQEKMDAGMRKLLAVTPEELKRRLAARKSVKAAAPAKKA